MTDFDRSAPPPQAGAAVFLQVGLGIALVFALHVVVGGSLWGAAALADGFEGPISETLATLATLWAMGLGLAQLAYVAPVAAALSFVRRPIALGMAIGAALTFGLQGACYGLVVGTVMVGYGAL